MTEEIKIDNKIPNIPDIEQLREKWAFALMKKGLLVRLEISSWEGIASLDFEELGIQFDSQDVSEFAKEYIRLGRLKLLPAKIIKEISAVIQKARQTLKQYSFNTVWGRFVPWTALETWEKENKVDYDEFVEMVKSFGNKYNEIIADVGVEYRKLARDSWHRLYPNDKAGPTEAFVTNFVNKIIEKIPSKEKILSYFLYNVSYSAILMPSIIEDDSDKTDNSDKKDFGLQLDKQLKKRLVEQYVRERKLYIDGFLDSTVNSVRQYVVKTCSKILVSVSKAKLTDKNKARIREMTKNVKCLNFYGDKEIDLLLGDLETEIDKFKGEIKLDNVIQKLEEIIKVASVEFVPEEIKTIMMQK